MNKRIDSDDSEYKDVMEDESSDGDFSETELKEAHEETEENNSLENEIQNLTQAIERLSLQKEKILKITSESRSKDMTNNVMDLLRKDGNTKSRGKKELSKHEQR